MKGWGVFPHFFSKHFEQIADINSNKIKKDMRTIFQCVIAAGVIVVARLYNLVVTTDLISATFIIVGLLYALAMYFTTIPFVVSDLTTQDKIQGIMEKAQNDFANQFIFITIFFIISLWDNLFALGMVTVSGFSVIYYYVNIHKLIKHHEKLDDKF